MPGTSDDSQAPLHLNLDKQSVEPPESFTISWAREERSEASRMRSSRRNLRQSPDYPQCRARHNSSRPFRYGTFPKRHYVKVGRTRTIEHIPLSLLTGLVRYEVHGKGEA